MKLFREEVHRKARLSGLLVLSTEHSSAQLDRGAVARNSQLAGKGLIAGMGGAWTGGRTYHV